MLRDGMEKSSIFLGSVYILFGVTVFGFEAEEAVLDVVVVITGYKSATPYSLKNSSGSMVYASSLSLHNHRLTVVT